MMPSTTQTHNNNFSVETRLFGADPMVVGVHKRVDNPVINNHYLAKLCWIPWLHSH